MTAGWLASVRASRFTRLVLPMPGAPEIRSLSGWVGEALSRSAFLSSTSATLPACPTKSAGQDGTKQVGGTGALRGIIRDNEAAWSTARHVLGEVLNHANSRLTAECIALVSGLIYSGDSMTDIAKRHGISRAAVSKRCVELTELLNLRPSRAMRSLTARKSYRSARINNTRSHEPTDPTPKP